MAMFGGLLAPTGEGLCGATPGVQQCLRRLLPTGEGLCGAIPGVSNVWGSCSLLQGRVCVVSSHLLVVVQAYSSGLL